MKLITELTDEHGILTTKLTKVTDYMSAEIEEKLQDMAYIMTESGGIGLTANQVGLTDKMFVMMLNDKIEHVINPVILTRSKETIVRLEGCLSYPEKGQVPIRRNDWIRVRYHDGKEQHRCDTLNGINAVIFQHEYDHCNGKCKLA